MAFTWEQFLDTHNVHYVRSGPNVGRDNIAIKCPFCSDDPSYHMGISLRGRGWHCWREPSPGSHSGRAPQKLVMALLNCTYSVANALVRSETVVPNVDNDTFYQDTQRKLNLVSNIIDLPKQSDKLTLLPEFKPLAGKDDGRAAMIFYPYLVKRGFSVVESEQLTDLFSLWYTMTGPFCYRIIIPIHHKNKLVNWTGRTVGNDLLRYKTLSHDRIVAEKSGLPRALRNIKECLFDYDNIQSGRILVVTEGPFDAMRITLFGERFGIHGTCLFGKALAATQLELLRGLRQGYDEIVTLFDADTDITAFSIFPDDLDTRRVELPYNIKDPAELSRHQFAKLFL